MTGFRRKFGLVGGASQKYRAQNWTRDQWSDDTERMNREQLILGTLFSLFDLANELGHTESVRVARIAGRLGVPTLAVRAALAHLEERDLVDAERVRLTLRGLSVSAAFRSQQATQAPARAA